MSNIGNTTHGFPILVLPTQLTSLQSDTSANWLLNICTSITPITESRAIYSGLCNETIPDGNNDMVVEKTSSDKEVEKVHWKKPYPPVKPIRCYGNNKIFCSSTKINYKQNSSVAINIQKPKEPLTSTINILNHSRNIQNRKDTQTLNHDNEHNLTKVKSTKSEISQVGLHKMDNSLNSPENKQMPTSSITKRKSDTGSKGLNKPKIQKQLDAPVSEFKSPTFHTNNTDSKGLYKYYEEEEYACGLFLAQLASAKISYDPLNVILANISESNKPQTSMDISVLKESSLTLTYGSTEESDSKESVEQICYDASKFKCLLGKEAAKSTSLEVSNRSYQCKHCKKHFLTLTAFKRHLVRRKNTNLTTTGDSRKNVNEKLTRHNGHNLNCKCINCKILLNSERKVFQCKDCKKIFSNFDDFSKHQIKTHCKFNCGNCTISNAYYRLINYFGTDPRKCNCRAGDKDTDIPKNQATTHSVSYINQNLKNQAPTFQHLSNLDTLALVANNIQYNEKEFTGYY